MLTGTDIVYISSIEWNFLWQIHQEVALRFAAAGNRVLYVENTGIRSPGLRDVGRIGSRLKRWIGAARSSGVREVAPGVFVCSPVVLPPFGSPARRRLNRRVFLRSVSRAAAKLGFRDPILWTYLPTDTAIDLIDILRTENSKVVYYCVADFAVLSDRPDELKIHEEILARTSDVLLAHCRSLVDHLSLASDRCVHLFSAGVDINAFPRLGTGNAVSILKDSTPLSVDLAMLDSLKSSGMPLIGYVGGLHRFVDQELIAAMAALRPDWNWVFVGPEQVSTEAIRKYPNVHLLGSRQHAQLVHYLEKFSACVIPYKMLPETEAVAPVKLKEYLATSKPIVSVRLPAVVDFDEEHNVIQLSDANATDFIRSIEVALSTDSTSLRERRRAVAELSDWEDQIRKLSNLILGVDVVHHPEETSVTTTV